MNIFVKTAFIANIVSAHLLLFASIAGAQSHTQPNCKTTDKACEPHEHQAKHHPRQLRKHTAIQAKEALHLYPATQAPISANQFTSTIDGPWRIITSNAIAQHLTGQFPNLGNPNTIAAQTIIAKIPATPKLTDMGEAKPIKEPGWALNGVPFDPGAGEFFQGNPRLGWQYEALSGALALGLDENHAHVQPTGKYHYHGLPTLYLNSVKLSKTTHSPHIGWAADGFPIYAKYAFSDPNNSQSSIIEMTPSWQLKTGQRPTEENQPGGRYDGTFTADYEYIAGSGTLDECNGRITVTPQYPEGIYAYYLTERWPVIPRCVKGRVDTSLKRRPPPR